jgi:hypothetical protein
MLVIPTGGTFGASSERVDFVYETLSTKRGLNRSGRITGTRSRYQGAVRSKSYMVQGVIALQPGPATMSQWLPRILGGTPSGTNFPLGEVLPEVDVLVERENGVFRYNKLQVAQGILRGTTVNGGDGDELIDMMILLIGKEEVINGESWPSDAPEIGDTVEHSPYTHWEGSLNLSGSARDYDKFNLMIDNVLDVKFRNSRTPKCIRSTDRQVKLETVNPFLTTTLSTALALNETPNSGALSFTQGNMSTTFAFPALRNVFETPTTRGRDEIPLAFQLEAYRTAASPELVVTHDASA